MLINGWPLGKLWVGRSFYSETLYLPSAEVCYPGSKGWDSHLLSIFNEADLCVVPALHYLFHSLQQPFDMCINHPNYSEIKKLSLRICDRSKTKKLVSDYGDSSTLLFIWFPLSEWGSSQYQAPWGAPALWTSSHQAVKDRLPLELILLEIFLF